MKTVLLRLEGPMQSWGTSSRFELRDTQPDPSKSGVVGLVGAALGVRREDDAGIARLAGLQLAVRIDRAGVVRTDFHTAGGGKWPGRDRYGVYKASGKQGGDATLSRRDYLADASFLVGLGGDAELVADIDAALRSPRWPLFLGRKGFAPSAPVAVGVVEGTPSEALRDAERPRRSDGPGWLVIECVASDGEPRQDVPLSFVPDRRRFGTRHVRRERLGWEAGS